MLLCFRWGVETTWQTRILRCFWRWQAGYFRTYDSECKEQIALDRTSLIQLYCSKTDHRPSPWNVEPFSKQKETSRVDDSIFRSNAIVMGRLPKIGKISRDSQYAQSLDHWTTVAPRRFFLTFEAAGLSVEPGTWTYQKLLREAGANLFVHVHMFSSFNKKRETKNGVLKWFEFKWLEKLQAL